MAIASESLADAGDRPFFAILILGSDLCDTEIWHSNLFLADMPFVTTRVSVPKRAPHAYPSYYINVNIS